MEHIIIAFSNTDTCQKCKGALLSSGIRVYSICTSVAAVLRNISGAERGIIISGFKFADGTVNNILKNMPWGFSMLSVSQEQPLKHKNPKVFYLPKPVTNQAIVASVRMIQQFNEIEPPRQKNDEEIICIAAAKNKLMHENNITENEAHMLIQRNSMRLRCKAGDIAKRILDGRITYIELKI